MGRVISKLGEKSRNLRGYPLHDSFTLLSFFVGWVGGFLKTASALGCGILHPDPKDIYFEWINSDRSISYLWTISCFFFGEERRARGSKFWYFVEPLVIAKLMFLCNSVAEVKHHRLVVSPEVLLYLIPGCLCPLHRIQLDLYNSSCTNFCTIVLVVSTRTLL